MTKRKMDKLHNTYYICYGEPIRVNLIEKILEKIIFFVVENFFIHKGSWHEKRRSYQGVNWEELFYKIEEIGYGGIKRVAEDSHIPRSTLNNRYQKCVSYSPLPPNTRESRVKANQEN
ncbi:hypothetical protein M0811_05494 [Anaeramoeba ignava]|uniref:Uncharacterized protein n=1 Tax=Anaeramoeba ignava TaxID=1746090 RepID=A0A9Q0RGI9_ANAIG|nr:hypothetical protein M0811_05494 [Anaeramoeba ignava]